MIVYLQKHIAGFTGRVTYMITPGITQQVISVASIAILVQVIVAVDVFFSLTESEDVTFGETEPSDVEF